MKKQNKVPKFKRVKKKEDPPIKSNSFAWLDFSRLINLILLISLVAFYPGGNAYFKAFAFEGYKGAREVELDKLKTFTIPYVINPTVSIPITADATYVIDLDSATPLSSKNQNKQLFPASTTKIVTALTAYDIFKLDSVLTVKRTITEGQVAGLIAGEKLTFENLLYALLVHSGNDAAYAIADNYSEGYDQFIIDMNRKAQELGMKNSRFTNPAGLDATGQYTSAFDLSLAARMLLLNKELAKIVSIKSITISDVDYTYFHPLTNVNKLLGEIAGVGGVKTGYTENAKENLVSFYSHEGKKFLIVILKSDDRFEDTRSVIEWLKTNVGFKQMTI